MSTQLPSFWKRVIICTFLRRKQARIARAYNFVCADLWKMNRIAGHDYLVALGNQKWECLYLLDNKTPPPAELKNFEDENERLQSEVSWMQGRIAQLERENKLIKATAKRMALARKEARHD